MTSLDQTEREKLSPIGNNCPLFRARAADPVEDAGERIAPIWRESCRLRGGNPLYSGETLPSGEFP